jgi:hypothetical protein
LGLVCRREEYRRRIGETDDLPATVKACRSPGYPDRAAANTMQPMTINAAISHTSRVI